MQLVNLLLPCSWAGDPPGRDGFGRPDGPTSKGKEVT
jgi:hypothetical protein